jgi:NTP pyrophosphatase (non-canonical NTP hydrolase)
MTFDEYQKLAIRTINPKLTREERLDMLALGLSGESGEVADVVKKMRYHSHPLDVDKLLKECGDVMWYVAGLVETCSLPSPCFHNNVDCDVDVFQCLNRDYVPGNTRDACLSLTALRLNRFAAFAGEIVERLVYTGPFHNVEDISDLTQDCREVTRWCAILATVLERKFSDVLLQNAEKLKRRYPDGFTAERSINRSE